MNRRYIFEARLDSRRGYFFCILIIFWETNNNYHRKRKNVNNFLKKNNLKFVIKEKASNTTSPKIADGSPVD